MANEPLIYPRCPICGCAYRYRISKPTYRGFASVEWLVALKAALCRPKGQEANSITSIYCPKGHPFNRTRCFVFYSILEFHAWYYATISSEAPIDHLKEMQDQSSEGSEVDVHAGISPAANQHGPNQ